MDLVPDRMKQEKGEKDRRHVAAMAIHFEEHKHELCQSYIPYTLGVALHFSYHQLNCSSDIALT